MQFLVTIQGGYNFKKNKPSGFPYTFNGIHGFPFPGLRLFPEAVCLSLKYITILNYILFVIKQMIFKFLRLIPAAWRYYC